MSSRRSNSIVSSSRRSSGLGVNASRLGISGRLGHNPSRRELDKNAKNNNKKNIRVIVDGEDVTPKSVLSSAIRRTIEVDKTESKSSFNFSDSRAFGPPPELCQSSFNSSVIQASQVTGGGVSKSIMMGSMMSSRATSLDSITSEMSICGIRASVKESDDDLAFEEREALTLADLKKMVFVTLSETDTISLFEMDRVSVSINDFDADSVKESNEKYDKLCSIREGNDTYKARGMQTFNDALKSKEMQTMNVELHDVGVSATSYDMFDTYNVKATVENDDDQEEGLGAITQGNRKASTDTGGGKRNSLMNQSTLEGGSRLVCAASVDDVALSQINLAPSQTTVQSSGAPLTKPEDKFDDDGVSNAEMIKLSKLSSMKENLFIMERIVVQNVYHPKQYTYRGLTDFKLGYGMHDLCDLMENKSRLTPNISRLWAYECASTRNLAVTCMAWNEHNKDILAVGYSEDNGKGKGVVCIWSVKNPEYPERLYSTSYGVMSVDFAHQRPNLLAVGLYNGSIVLYNIQSIADNCVLDSGDSTGKHSDPVWQVRWVRCDKGSGEDREEEVLVSSSGDGRITQWTITKGFEFSDIMKVKRTSVKKQKETPSKKSDALISRFSPALCFAFQPHDGNTYLVGTEDTFVHRCSCSYNEQFLETFGGHKSPVYKVAWSPFDDKIFLTCSADWSSRLWHVDRTEPIFIFQASIKAVVDIDWSPMSSTVFTAISENQVEIWDLEDSILDPIIIHSPVNKTTLSSVKFALNAEVLLVGDCDGFTTVYQLSEVICKESKGDNVKLTKIVEQGMPDSGMNYHDV